jgi:hypothetical protein
MTRETFQINILGPAGPEEVSVGYLFEFLGRLEKLVKEYASAKGLEIPAEGPILSLIDVKTGSEGLVLSVPAPAARAISAASKAVLLGDYAELPRLAHQELFGISEQLRQRDWSASFEENLAVGIAPAKITPDRGVPAPPEPTKIRGTTTLLARCLRVGGATVPKAEIRLSQTGELLYVAVSEEIARALGRRLYDEVALEGTATWDAETWKILDFRITRATDFTRVEPHKAMEELAQTAGGHWDGVDALEYVRRLRGYGENESG